MKNKIQSDILNNRDKIKGKIIKYLWIGLLSLVLIFLIVSCSESDENIKSSQHTTVVKDLVDLFNSDPSIRSQVVSVLNEQEETSFWYGKSIEDMYDFFDQWLVYLPTPADARKYMDTFYEFTNSTGGRAVILEEPFRNWLYEFMMARGKFMNSELSAIIIPSWTSDPEMHIEDYIIPSNGFQSFNDFFIRHIRPEVRPIAEPNNNAVLSSPADCTVMKITNTLTLQSTIEVKGDALSIKQLLGEDELSDVFIGGKAVLCMLSTTDYHRFHSPVAGKIISEAQLAGLYYGMTGGWVD